MPKSAKNDFRKSNKSVDSYMFFSDSDVFLKKKNVWLSVIDKFFFWAVYVRENDFGGQ